jgi:hypothetical protein
MEHNMEYNQGDIDSVCMGTKWVEYSGSQDFSGSPNYIQGKAAAAFYSTGNAEMILSVQSNSLADVPVGYTLYSCEEGKSLFRGESPKYDSLIRGPR